MSEGQNCHLCEEFTKWTELESRIIPLLYNLGEVLLKFGGCTKSVCICPNCTEKVDESLNRRHEKQGVRMSELIEILEDWDVVHFEDNSECPVFYTKKGWRTVDEFGQEATPQLQFATKVYRRGEVIWSTRVQPENSNSHNQEGE